MGTERKLEDGFQHLPHAGLGSISFSLSSLTQLNVPETASASRLTTHACLHGCLLSLMSCSVDLLLLRKWAYSLCYTETYEHNVEKAPSESSPTAQHCFRQQHQAEQNCEIKPTCHPWDKPRDKQEIRCYNHWSIHSDVQKCRALWKHIGWGCQGRLPEGVNMVLGLEGWIRVAKLKIIIIIVIRPAPTETEGLNGMVGCG